MKADIITKDYLKDPRIFADIFNCFIYGGEQVIRPENLSERDTAKIALPYGSDGTRVMVQKFRDVQNLYAAKTDGKVEYVLFGIESQTNVHLAMPVRNGLYDMLDYASQVEQTAKAHGRGAADSKKPAKEEFLSGFWREDRLIPSITLTIYFSADPWDGPLSLLEMMGEVNPQIRAYINDYRIYIMAPAHMSDEDIMKLDSSMREVLLFIKYSNDNKSLEKILQSYDRFKNLERRAAEVIEVITKSDLKYDEREETVNMCEAIRQMRAESEKIGEKRAMSAIEQIRLESERIGEERAMRAIEQIRFESERIGEARGEKRGEERGEIIAKKSAAENLNAMGLAIDKIAQALNEPTEIIKEWLKLK